MKRTLALIPGLILTAVGLAFNSSYGWSLGGDDTLRCFGMAGVFVACVGLKDWMLGHAAVSISQRKFGLAIACSIGLLIGAAGSFLAAFGSASEGRDAKADPRQAQITAYQTAKKIEAETEKKLQALGDVPGVSDAKARVARLLADVDPGIAKRTSGCTVLPTDVGKRVQQVNREACQDIIDAQSVIAKAGEASTLQAKLDEAREVIARGAPKAADPGAENLQRFLKSGMDAASIMSLLVAVVVELGAPICWLIFQLSAPVAPVVAQPAPVRETLHVPHRPTGGGRRAPGRKRDENVVAFVTEFRKRHGRNPRIPEMRERFPQLDKSTLWRNAQSG